MGRFSAFVTLALLAGVGIGWFARSAFPGILRGSGHAADLAAIEKLHQEDIAVTLTQDPTGLVDIWAQDGVRLTPGNACTVGKQAIAAENAKFRSQHPDFKVLSYMPEYKDIEIADGWAIEMGHFQATYKLSAKDVPASIEDKGVRVLKRSSDGSWKFAVIGLK
jgi:hypothetical protein